MLSQSLKLGKYTLGPENGTLLIQTGKTGPASTKAGHNLLIEVTSWEATLVLDKTLGEASATFTADSRSLAVRSAIDGEKPVPEDDKPKIDKTIADEVLKGTAIEFRSTSVTPSADESTVAIVGEFTIAGRTRSLSFEIELAPDGRVTGQAVFKQTDWGIKLYSTMLGALRVADEVQVSIDATAVSS